MKILYKHVVMGFITLAVSTPFWFGRLDWDPEMRLWRATGDVSFVLLVFALSLGPLARHFGRFARLLHWRREFGIWFTVLAVAHTLLVLDGWVRWDWMRFFGYEFVVQLDRYARIEPGFGLSNLVGIIATFISIPLMITSADWAVKHLGGSSWKWLHYAAYTVFYLVVLHSIYFLFVHYTESFHRPVPDSLNWFRYPFLTTAVLLIALQWSAFYATVKKRNANNTGR